MAAMRGVLIGCGAIAREHLTALKELNVDVPAICDLSPARAEATAQRFGVEKWYTDYRTMLAENSPDLVHITTPPSSHFQIAHDCLSMGLNVMSEKPITIDYEDFSVLKRLAIKNRCVLMENQNARFNSSIQQISNLVKSGMLGDVLDVQILFSINVLASGSPYADRDAPHFALALRGGVIGDFLTHIACLAHMFMGSVVDLRTVWAKRAAQSPLPADEFRAILHSELATGYVGFSGNGELNGEWVRVLGTRMHAETNLLEPPRLILRRVRSGEPALMSVIDGLVETRDVFRGTLASFWRKLGGTGSYDGFSELIGRVYQCLQTGQPQPVSLDEIDEIARLVDRFTRPSLQLGELPLLAGGRECGRNNSNFGASG